MANTFADLISGAASAGFHAALVAGLLARAQAGAADPANATPNRARWDRRLEQRPDLLDQTATTITTAVATSSAIETSWTTNGTYAQSDVETACEAQLVLIAADTSVTPFQAIERAMTDPTTISILRGACAAAANAIMADVTSSQTMLDWVRSRCSSYQDLATIAQQATPLLISHPTLAPYGGDLADVPDADIVPTIQDLVKNWIRQGVAP